MTLALVVICLGATGAVIRALVSRTLPPLLGTLAINLTAAFFLGLSTPWAGLLADGVRIGLLGAASTWSTLANELAMLLRDRRFFRAGLYVILSLLLGVGAAWVGLELSGS